MSDIITGAVAFAFGVLLGRWWRRRVRAARVEAAWLRGLLEQRRPEDDWRDAAPPIIRIGRKD